MENQIIECFLSGTFKTSKEIGNFLGIKDYKVRRVLNKLGYYFGHYTPFKKDEEIIISSALEEIITGSLLGDGSITKYKIDSNTKTNNNSNLVIKHSLKQRDYVRYKKYLISKEQVKVYFSEKSRFDKRTNKVYQTSCIETQQNSVFNSYRDKWYPKGIKIVPEDIIITPLVLAIWFMDDGTKAGESGYYLCTNNFSVKDCLLLQNKLLNLNIESTLHYNNNKPVIYIPQKSILSFNSYVYPYIHKSMLYKLIVRSKNPFKIGNP